MVAHPAYPAIARWGSQYGLPGGSAPRDNSIYVFFDCNGSELTRYRKNDGASAKHLADTMTAILKEKGKGVSFSKYRKLLPDFKKAEKLLEVGWYAGAHKIFKTLSKKKFKPTPPMIETSKGRLKEITDKVSDLFKEIKEKAESGEKAGALVELYVLRARCRGLRITTDITKAISGLEKEDSITADDKKKASMEAKGCEIYLKAEGYAADGNEKSAKNYFERVTNIYKDTSFCEKAKERLEEFN
jgi:hypothetical protein